MSRLLVDRPALGVLRVALDRPDRRNAIDGQALEELSRVFNDAKEPVTVLGSTDPRAFCSGGDLSLAPAELSAVSDGLFLLYEELLELPTIIVAAVDGVAVGAGAQLLLAADLRVGGPDTRISFAGAGTGLALGTWGLPGLVGRGRATDLALTGRMVEGAEARAIGLIDRLVDDVPASALELATSLASAPAAATGAVKRLVREGEGLVERLRRERGVNEQRLHVAAGSHVPRDER